MTIQTLVRKAQEAMNKSGSNLTVDGDWGAKSQVAADKYEFKIEAKQLATTNPISVVHFVEPTFVKLDGVEFEDRGNYATPSGKFKGLTIHYTVSGRSVNSAKNVLNYLKDSKLGCMVMDENGLIYIPKNFDVLKNWGHHSGISKWKGIERVSNHFAGMEICCFGLNSAEGPFRTVKASDGYIVGGKYQQYTEAQEKSLVNFILWAKSKNPEFDLDYVVGHDELRKEAGKPGDKQDPGGSLSMTMPTFRNLIKLKAAALGI